MMTKDGEKKTMAKLLGSLGLAVLLLVGAGRAEAVIGTADPVPAATLLLPYFEVDLKDPSGLTTLLSINNASATAILAHVTLWTDLGVPTFAYNVYLTGFDVQTINLRDVFNGTVSRTASDGQDPQDNNNANDNAISNQGLFSQDINFASCTGQLPPPPVPPQLIDHIRNSHTGLQSGIFDGCVGQFLNDNVARGYVTVDTVNNCTLRVAGDPGYFVNGGVGDATNQNVLWGDYFFVNPSQNFAQGDALVSIEGSAVDPETSIAGEYTFYGRNVAWVAGDNREPLFSKSASRFLQGGGFDGGTRLVVWRDPKTAFPVTLPNACNALPSWFPLGQEDLIVFDEQEQAQNVGTLRPFPAVAQSVLVNGPAMPLPQTFGWLYANLNHVQGDPNLPPEDPQAAQSFVSNLMSAEGRYSVGQRAIQIENAAAATHLCADTAAGSGPCN